MYFCCCVKGIIQDFGNFVYLFSCRELDERINTTLIAQHPVKEHIIVLHYVYELNKQYISTGEF